MKFVTRKITDLALLIGNHVKAKAKLSWKLKITPKQLRQMMVEAGLRPNAEGWLF